LALVLRKQVNGLYDNYYFVKYCYCEAAAVAISLVKEDCCILDSRNEKIKENLPKFSNVKYIFYICFEIQSTFMEKEKYLQDLKDIKDIMDRSSRFISLSGGSGIAAGIVALLGAYAAYQYVYVGQDFLAYKRMAITSDRLLILLGIASATLFLAVGLGIYFTSRKAKKNKQQLWDQQTKRLVLNLFIPLAAGGILCLILLSKGFIGFVAPFTLIFYGLALVNASKYTLREVRSLGILEILLGLIGTNYIGFGLLFWVIGFGVLHILYGIIMKVKYKD
jgi:hypothetical protein